MYVCVWHIHVHVHVSMNNTYFKYVRLIFPLVKGLPCQWMYFWYIQIRVKGYALLLIFQDFMLIVELSHNRTEHLHWSFCLPCSTQVRCGAMYMYMYLVDVKYTGEKLMYIHVHVHVTLYVKHTMYMYIVHVKHTMYIVHVHTCTRTCICTCTCTCSCHTRDPCVRSIAHWYSPLPKSVNDVNILCSFCPP